MEMLTLVLGFTIAVALGLVFVLMPPMRLIQRLQLARLQQMGRLPLQLAQPVMLETRAGGRPSELVRLKTVTLHYAYEAQI